MSDADSRLTADRVAKGMLVVGFASMAFYGYRASWPIAGFVHDFYPPVSTSLLSISLTVLLIDRLTTQASLKERRSRLIREMGSSDQATAVRAAKEIRAANWFADGSLNNADFTLADLKVADLNQFNLRGAILNEAKLSGADLRGAILVGAFLENCTAEGTKFQGAFLKDVSLKYAHLSESHFDEVDLSGGIDFIHAEFVRASLRGADLSGAQLEQCDFERCDLTRAILKRAVLRNANLAGSTLDYAMLERADLKDIIGWERIASMTGARIAGIENAPAGFREAALAKGAIETWA